MDKKKADQLIIELMDISEACCLTTIDSDGFPQSRAMLNLRNSNQYPELVSFFKKFDDFSVYFTTNTSSQKVNQIKTNPNVSVYYSKPDEWRGLMLGGKIEIIEDQKIKNMLWQKNWTLYYKEGPQDKDYAILKLNPKILKLYHQLNFFTINMD